MSRLVTGAIDKLTDEIQKIRKLLASQVTISADALLTLLLGVDGPGSGLDADLLDGLSPEQVANENPEIYATNTSSLFRVIRLDPIDNGEDNFLVTCFRNLSATPERAEFMVFKGDGSADDPIVLNGTDSIITVAGNEVYHQGNFDPLAQTLNNGAYRILEHSWTAGDNSDKTWAGIGGLGGWITTVQKIDGSAANYDSKGLSANVWLQCGAIDARYGGAGGLSIRKNSGYTGLSMEVVLMLLSVNL